MPRIPNWPVQSENTWKNTETGDKVKVVSYDAGNTTLHKVTLNGRRPYDRPDFTAIEDARTYARNWMKKHPKG